jgi:mRNA interferase RelE/StbE
VPYQIRYTKDALKALRKMTRNLAILVEGKIAQLADGGKALAGNIKKLQGRDGYRLRVGDYRVIYTIDNGALVIIIVKIGFRGDVYE